MCNLSDLIEGKAFRRGWEKGLKEGREELKKENFRYNIRER